MIRIGFTGGRDYSNRKRVEEVIDRLISHYGTDFTVVHGGASGADRLVDEVSTDRGITSKHVFPAEWKMSCNVNFCKPGHRRKRGDGSSYCPAAGPRRNWAMVDSGLDLVVAFDGGKGTADMMRRSHQAGITIWRITDG